MRRRSDSAQILLDSANETNPNGLANGSDQVGRNLMDHMYALSTAGILPNGPMDSYYKGRRPTGHLHSPFPQCDRGGRRLCARLWLSRRRNRAWAESRAQAKPGIGAEMKEKAHKLGPWMVFISGFGEMLPDPDNRVTLHATRKDKWGIADPAYRMRHGPQ